MRIAIILVPALLVGCPAEPNAPRAGDVGATPEVAIANDLDDSTPDAIAPDVPETPDTPAPSDIEEPPKPDVPPDPADMGCIEGQACDDGNPCTDDDVCNPIGQCLGTFRPGCCLNDTYCNSSDPCTKGTCLVATGECEYQAAAGCCVVGACCDTATGMAHAPGTPCGTSAAATEYSCDGAIALSRTAVAGCDGSQTADCSVAPEYFSWSGWDFLAQCPSGGVCVLVDAKIQPKCGPGVAMECTVDTQCDPGLTCAVGKCVAGECQAVAANVGGACGQAPIDKLYGCDSPDNGGAVIAVDLYAACDGMSLACTGGNTVATPPVVIQQCDADEACVAGPTPSIKGNCVSTAGCDAGLSCCTDQGKIAGQGTVCSMTVASTQTQCVGTQVLQRVGYPGCSGQTATSCSIKAEHIVWGAWKVLEQCTGGEVCLTQPGGGHACDDEPVGPQCTFGSCCTADGQYEEAGTICSSFSTGTKYTCGLGPDGAEAVLVQKRYDGCSGASASCSFATEDAVWTEPDVYEACAANQACEPYSFEQLPGSCEDLTPCIPGDECCGADGQYLPTGSQCGDEVLEVEYQCEAEVKGGWIQSRDILPGCSPWNSCETSAFSSYVYESDWEDVMACPDAKTCDESFDDNEQPDCADDCFSGSCCSDDGDYLPMGTACSDFANSSKKYECTVLPDGLAAITEQISFPGCSGTSSSCSFSSSNYVWSDPETYEICAPTQACEPYTFGDSSPGECVNTTPCLPDSECCDGAGEWLEEKAKCGDEVLETEYQCTEQAPGGTIQVQTLHPGCSSFHTCETSQFSFYVHESGWMDVETCAPDETCLESFFSDEPPTCN